MPERDSKGPAFLLFMVMAASVLGMIYYQYSRGKEKPALDTSGFNLSIDTATTSAAPPSAPAGQAPSSLNMAGKAEPQMKFGAKPASKSKLDRARQAKDEAESYKLR